MAERRLKHWGWGYEDQQPPHDEVVAAAAGIRAHLGFGEGEVERPVALEDVRAAPPRGSSRPAALSAICSSTAHERCLARAGQGLPGRGARLPRRVPEPAGRGGAPARRGRRRRPAGLVRGRGRRRGPVRRRHQRRGRRGGARGRAAGGDASTCAGSTGCSRWTPTSRGGPDPGRRHGPGAGGAAEGARAHAAPLPAVVRVLDARRLDRHPGGRPLRHPVDPHRRPGGVGAGDHPRRRSGRAAGCPAPARGPAPTGC